VFTEHRDTLHYLVDKLRAYLGRPEAVVAFTVEWLVKNAGSFKNGSLRTRIA